MKTLLNLQSNIHEKYVNYTSYSPNHKFKANTKCNEDDVHFDNVINVDNNYFITN